MREASVLGQARLKDPVGARKPPGAAADPTPPKAPNDTLLLLPLLPAMWLPPLVLRSVVARREPALDPAAAGFSIQSNTSE